MQACYWFVGNRRKISKENNVLLLNKNYASLKTQANNLYELTDSDIQRMHTVLLEIYDDLYKVCEKHNLKLIAGGGTLLGVIRHKGFIPWDDDMDLSMTREDYEKFKSIFDSELSDKYDLLAPGYPKGAKVFLMRVLKKNTTLLNMIDENSPYSNGIYIDIVPIDYVPENKIIFYMKAFLVDALRFVSYSVYWNQYKSKSLHNYMINSEGKFYYKLRMFVGKLFGFLSAEIWFELFDKACQSKPSKKVTVAAGRKKYIGETYSIEVYFPPKKVLFENRTIFINNDAETYLKKMYGNYMEIPPIEKREKHLCLKLDFNI